MEIKDSGERRTFSTGSVRDVSEGKGRCEDVYKRQGIGSGVGITALGELYGGGEINAHSLVSSRYACDVGPSVSDDYGVFDEPHYKDNQ